LIFEENLIWSERLRKSLVGLGHEAIVISRLGAEIPTGDVAILNFGSILWSEALVARLRESGVKTIGHAGHKEKEKLELGRIAGIDTVVTNSTLTYKLETILQDLTTC
jgi:hypothetical protein